MKNNTKAGIASIATNLDVSVTVVAIIVTLVVILYYLLGGIDYYDEGSYLLSFEENELVSSIFFRYKYATIMEDLLGGLLPGTVGGYRYLALITSLIGAVVLIGAFWGISQSQGNRLDGKYLAVTALAIIALSLTWYGYLPKTYSYNSANIFLNNIILGLSAYLVFARVGWGVAAFISAVLVCLISYQMFAKFPTAILNALALIIAAASSIKLRTKDALISKTSSSSIIFYFVAALGLLFIITGVAFILGDGTTQILNTFVNHSELVRVRTAKYFIKFGGLFYYVANRYVVLGLLFFIVSRFWLKNGRLSVNQHASYTWVFSLLVLTLAIYDIVYTSNYLPSLDSRVFSWNLGTGNLLSPHFAYFFALVGLILGAGLSRPRGLPRSLVLSGFFLLILTPLVEYRISAYLEDIWFLWALYVLVFLLWFIHVTLDKIGSESSRLPQFVIATAILLSPLTGTMGHSGIVNNMGAGYLAPVLMYLALTLVGFGRNFGDTVLIHGRYLIAVGAIITCIMIIAGSLLNPYHIFRVESYAGLINMLNQTESFQLERNRGVIYLDEDNRNFYSKLSDIVRSEQVQKDGVYVLAYPDSLRTAIYTVGGNSLASPFAAGHSIVPNQCAKRKSTLINPVEKLIIVTEDIETFPGLTNCLDEIFDGSHVNIQKIGQTPLWPYDDGETRFNVYTVTP